MVGTAGGQPVYLGEVAAVVDGPAEPVDYVRLHAGAARGAPAATAPAEPAVTIAIGKRRGSNAVGVA